MPPFHVVLSDVEVPKSERLIKEMGPAGPLLLMHASSNLVRGVGIFVPGYYESAFTDNIDDYHAIVASRACWTPDGKRDWRKLLELVVVEIGKLQARC